MKANRTQHTQHSRANAEPVKTSGPSAQRKSMMPPKSIQAPVQRVKLVKYDIPQHIIDKRIEQNDFSKRNYGSMIITDEEGKTTLLVTESDPQVQHTEEKLISQAISRGFSPDIFKNDPNDTSKVRVTGLYTERKPCESTNADAARRSRKDTLENCHNLVFSVFHENTPVYYSVKNVDDEHSRVRTFVKNLKWDNEVISFMTNPARLKSYYATNNRTEIGQALKRVCEKRGLDISQYRDYVAETDFAWSKSTEYTPELRTYIARRTNATLIDHYRALLDKYPFNTPTATVIKAITQAHTSLISQYSQEWDDKIASVTAFKGYFSDHEKNQIRQVYGIDVDNAFDYIWNRLASTTSLPDFRRELIAKQRELHGYRSIIANPQLVEKAAALNQFKGYYTTEQKNLIQRLDGIDIDAAFDAIWHQQATTLSLPDFNRELVAKHRELSVIRDGLNKIL